MLFFHLMRGEHGKLQKFLRSHLPPIHHRVGEWLGSVEDQEGIPDKSNCGGGGIKVTQISLSINASASV